MVKNLFAFETSVEVSVISPSDIQLLFSYVELVGSSECCCLRVCDCDVINMRDKTVSIVGDVFGPALPSAGPM